MSHGLFTDDFSEEPYWNSGLPQFEVRQGDPPAKIDVAVVGGGYAGLSAALSLAKSGRSVVVFEAKRVGDGAAARAAGSLGHVPKATLQDLTALYGEDVARSLYREARQAREYVETLIQELQITCELKSGWRYLAAHSERAFERLRASLPTLEETWGDVELLSRERQREAVGSDAFFGGVKIPQSATLQPALLQRGLAHAAINAGAYLMQNTPVTNVSGDIGHFQITSTGGSYHAHDVLLATNAETNIDTETISSLRRRIVTVPAYALATDVVPANTMRAVLPIDGPVSDTYKIINYIAPAANGTRFIMSARAGRSEGNLRSKATRIFKYFRDRFPDLADVRISHCWTGRFATTADWVPHVGIQNGIHYVLGCCGTGIPMSTYLGHMVAQMILNRSRNATAFDRPLPQLSFLGVERFLLPLAVRGYELRDRFLR